MNEESKSRREQQIENKLKEAMSRKKAPVVFRLCSGCGRPFPESRMGHVGNEVQMQGVPFLRKIGPWREGK